MTAQPITFFDVRGTLGAVRSYTCRTEPVLRSVYRELHTNGSTVGLAGRLCCRVVRALAASWNDQERTILDSISSEAITRDEVVVHVVTSREPRGQRLKRFEAGMICSQNPNVAASR
jgi:hypothetical protein